MNNSCASTDGQSHNLFKLTKIGGIQPNFRNIAAHLPEYVDQSDSSLVVLNDEMMMKNETKEIQGKKKMKQEIHFYIFRPLYTVLESEFPHLNSSEEIHCKEFEVYFSNTSI